jgi:beta-glucanase (GH16 family)
MQTLGKMEFRYGLAEARIQVPQGQGLVAQVWLLAPEAYEDESAWPGCGEIDLAEILGSEPQTVYGTLHADWPWAPTGVQGSASAALPLSGGFHTYALEWEPDRVTFMLDGAPYETVRSSELPAGSPWPFDHPFFLLLDLAVGGEWPGPPDASTRFPARMLVDWVRIWQ